MSTQTYTPDQTREFLEAVRADFQGRIADLKAETRTDTILATPAEIGTYICLHENGSAGITNTTLAATSLREIKERCAEALTSRDGAGNRFVKMPRGACVADEIKRLKSSIETIDDLIERNRKGG